ncbi:transposase [Geothermobacter hydrogeniphilus]
MERIPRQFYTQEFKEEAVSLVENGGLTVAEVSRRLSSHLGRVESWFL